MSSRAGRLARSVSLPVLYIDVDGVLRYVDRDGWQNRVEAEEFLEWAVQRFECRWLTSWNDPSRNLPRSLGIRVPEGIVEVRWAAEDAAGRPLGKSASINFSENFVWLDDAPTTFDLARLQRRGQRHRWIEVNPCKAFILNRLREQILDVVRKFP